MKQVNHEGEETKENNTKEPDGIRMTGKPQRETEERDTQLRTNKYGETPPRKKHGMTRNKHDLTGGDL